MHKRKVALLKLALRAVIKTACQNGGVSMTPVKRVLLHWSMTRLTTLPMQ